MFGNFTCYCQPPASDTYLTCVQDTCDKSDLQPAVEWAKKNCGGYDFRADGTWASVLATMTAATASSSSRSSTIGGSSARSSSSGTEQTLKGSTVSTTQSSSSAKGSSHGLSTSDIIAIAVGVPGSIAAIVGTFFLVKAYLRKRKALQKQEL